MGGVNRSHAASFLTNTLESRLSGQTLCIIISILFVCSSSYIYSIVLAYLLSPRLSPPSFPVSIFSIIPHRFFGFVAPSHGAHTIRFSFLSFVPFRFLGSCRRLHKGRLLVRKALVYVLTSANCPSRCSRPATRFSPVGLRDVCVAVVSAGRCGLLA